MSAFPDPSRRPPGHTPTCTAIGADAGGTKLALALTDGERVWHENQPSVNLRTESPDAFAARLAEHIHDALREVPLDENVSICVGAAGAGTDAVATACRNALAEHLHIASERVWVTSDARVALEAAFPGQDGILIITGTGSGCYGLDRKGRWLRAGGWGPGLEDPGSGSELGREAVKHLLSELEKGETGDFSNIIAHALLLDTGIAPQKCTAQELIPAVLDRFYGQGFHPASLAPLVLDALDTHDPVATGLVEQQCRALARQCARLAAMMDKPPLGRIALTGGLSKRDRYVQTLSGALQEYLPGAHATPLIKAPVEGALSWAQSRAKKPR